MYNQTYKTLIRHNFLLQIQQTVLKSAGSRQVRGCHSTQTNYTISAARVQVLGCRESGRTHLRGEHSLPAQGYRHFASGAAGRAPAPARAAPSTDPPSRLPTRPQTIWKTLSLEQFPRAKNLKSTSQFRTRRRRALYYHHLHSKLIEARRRKITIGIRLRKKWNRDWWRERRPPR